MVKANVNLLRNLGISHLRPSGRIGGSRGNGRIEMSCGDPLALLPTRDPADRAHEVKGEDGLYVPGADVPQATPRRYHPSQMSAGGVAWDSVFDATYRRERRLGVAGAVAHASGLAQVLAAAAVMGAGFRDATRRRTGTGSR